MDPITRTDPLGKLHVSNYKRAQSSHMLQNTKSIAINPKSNNSLLIAKAYTQFFSKKKKIVIATFHLNQQYHKCRKCFFLDKYEVAVPSKK